MRQQINRSRKFYDAFMIDIENYTYSHRLYERKVQTNIYNHILNHYNILNYKQNINYGP